LQVVNLHIANVSSAIEIGSHYSTETIKT